MQLLNATSIPQLMRLVEGGVIDVSKLVTHCKTLACYQDIPIWMKSYAD